MKKLVLSIICFSCFASFQAQQHAVTETGSTVVLFDDGTWQYENEVEAEELEIELSSKKFEKPEDASFLLKSKKLDVGFNLNPKKWTFQKGVDNPEAEYEITLKGEDLYAMVITEKIEIPLTTLRSVVIENAQSVASDLKVDEEEYRIVNGIKVLMIKMSGTAQGIKFTYYGYYYSNENGTVQFITYTAKNLMIGYLKDCEQLLNGLVKI